MTSPTQPQQRVVITAAGLQTPIGRGLDAFSDALRNGRSGIQTISLFDASAFPVHIAAEVPNFDPEEPIRTLRTQHPSITIPFDPSQDRKTALGLSAALDCLQAAAYPPNTQDPISLHLGTGLSSVTIEQLEASTTPAVSPDASYNPAIHASHTLQSSVLWRNVVSEASRLIRIALQSPGPNTTNFSACAASLQSVGRAARDIRLGRTKRAFAGGMDSMAHPFGMISFLRLGALNEEGNDDPQTASRPFDKDRSGFVLGEGAAILALESLEYALERGATPLAEIVGYGTSIDAHMVTAPHPQGAGAILAMRRCLHDAGVHPSDVDYINAHGTGTPLNDSTESSAIAALWREHGLETTPPVSSTKSMTGHLIAAAGALEVAACIAALQGSFLPPSINIQTPCPECPAHIVNAPKGPAADVRIAMTNSFGFGGQNASLLLKRWDGS